MTDEQWAIGSRHQIKDCNFTFLSLQKPNLGIHWQREREEGKLVTSPTFFYDRKGLETMRERTDLGRENVKGHWPL